MRDLDYPVLRSLDQPVRQAQPCAEQPFAAGHLALIGLMVVA
jgi:hypothetical protein